MPLQFLIVLFVLVELTLGQYGQSPCPGTFNYRNEGGTVYGYLQLYASQPVNTVTVMVNMTVATALPSRYVGRLEPLGTELQMLQDFNLGQPISYRLHFPVTNPVPRLTGLTVNGEVICYGRGDIAGPGQYVTTLSLQHTLYLKSGNLQVNHEYFSRPRPKPTNTNNVDTSVFGVSENPYQTDPDWATDYFNVVSNNTRPTYEYNPPPTQPPYEEPPRKRPSVPPRVQYPRPTPAPTEPPPEPPRHVECGVVAGGNNKVGLIYNGQSFDRGDWPWLVAIYRNRDGNLMFVCSGTLISNRHVVSAAHCMHQKSTRTSIKDIVLKIGVFNLDDWGDEIRTRKLSTAYIHESYNSKTLVNDILLMVMEQTVEFNSIIRPACLWEGNSDLRKIVGATGVVTGWGRSEFGNGGNGEPRMVKMPVVNTETCRASRPDFHKLTSAYTLCAGDRNGAGPCLGDSGGGLYILEGGRWRIRGVVSLSLRPDNGDNTCNLNEYIVFTDAAQYLPWIRTNMV